MSKTEVKVPDIGDYTDVPVIDILVADGDTVEKDQPLLVLESDKATMEVPAPAAGTVRDLKIKVGDKLSQGMVICALESDEANAPAAAPQADPQKPPEKPEPQPPAPEPAPASKPAAAKTGGGNVDVKIPDIGDYAGVPVIEVLVADGDTVDKDQPLLVLESDKATMEVPSPAAGTVRGMKVKVGDKVSQGDAVCVLEAAGPGDDAPAQEATAAPAARPAPAEAPPPPPSDAPRAAKPADSAASPAPASTEVPYAGPATRKFARELGVDLAQVKGSGPRGRIVVEDVQGFVKTRLAAPSKVAATSAGGAGIPPIPAVDFSQFGAIETKPLARIRKLSAVHLSRCWLNVPHVTQTDEADITEVEVFRKQQSEELAAAGGPKLTLLPILMKAVAVAMKTYPEFNASLSPDGESLIMKQYCYIGFAADTPNGLVVPVVRDVWSKGIAELSAECAALAKKARDGKLKPDEMKGGCFSISSLGGIGGSHFTPIVNAPEVGILGVSRALMKPVWDGKAFQPRLMCPLSLSYDHRVIDGAYAARFIVHLSRLLADVRRLLL
ncbi:MAG: dihydrolipoyllysine-residue acetyltransferase [Sinimarinibacterium flocculans]|uniref:dihydrolipoyllysine-residue acetyltransferase n=1 Tax=Sinimarinibacterium flocculans TaxID=985250 RepID=UPI003C333FF4